MLSPAAVGEVEDDSLHRVGPRRAVAPEVGAVRPAVAGLKHRHRRLVGVQHGMTQQLDGQSVDQRLQLNAAFTATVLASSER